LRAPRGSLEALADLVVPVRARSLGAWSPQRVLLPWSEIGRARVGLVTALARPERVLRLLASHQVVPRAMRTFPDHARLRLPKADVDMWLTTPKCAVHVSPTERNLWMIDHEPLLNDRAETLLRLVLDPAGSGSYLRKYRVNSFTDMLLAPER
jgi:tetraacyldisaccharide-1-P 4'-kinase